MKFGPLRLVVTSTLVTALALAMWAFVIEPGSLTSSKHELSIPRWQPALGGLRVAVLADLHVGSPHNGIAKLEKIVELTNSLNPDLVVIPGDLVIDDVLGGSFVEPDDIAAVLARLKAPLGVWACMGNHDWWHNAGFVAAVLEKQGIRVLEDKAVRIQHGGTHFWLLGISDFWEGPHDLRKAFAQVTDDAPVLAFTHNPDVFPTIGQRFSLLIAGHTHGGQVKLPFLGRPIVPSKFGERYAIGHVVEQNRHLFVSPGLGTSILPVRFRVPPEVSVLELKP